VDEVAVRARCSSCSQPLGFSDWSRGVDQCPVCVASARDVRASAVFIPEASADYRSYEQLLDDVPEELVDELIAAIQEEARVREMRRSNPSPVREVLDEIGVGQSPRELPWAIWGFVAGFAGNLAIAKYAQMASGSPLSDFLAPMLLGGLVAGATCSAIAWAVVRLREP